MKKPCPHHMKPAGTFADRAVKPKYGPHWRTRTVTRREQKWKCDRPGCGREAWYPVELDDALDKVCRRAPLTQVPDFEIAEGIRL